MTSKRPPKLPPPPPQRRRASPPPLPLAPTVPAMPAFGGDEGRSARREPSFNDNPTEAKTGQTSEVVGEWRMLLNAFDLMDDIGKAELCQVGECILRAYNLRRNRGQIP